MMRDRPEPYVGDRRWWWVPHWVRLPSRPTDFGGWAGWVFGVLAGIALLDILWQLAVRFWYLSLPAVAVAWFGADRHWQRRWADEAARRERLVRYRLTPDELDDMHWRDFELAVLHLMRRDGIEAEHTGKTGDFSGDVVGYDPVLGETWIVQAKRYGPNTRVGSDAVQKVAGSAWPIYRARLKLVVTTNDYTKDARAFSAKAGVELIDREDLIRWATDGVHLHDLLGVTPETVRHPGDAW